MNVDTMRKIDRRMGVPITFCLSIILWSFRLFQKRVNPDISKTLFIELSEMGSAILVDPAMRNLQENGSELYFAIFEDNYKSLNLLKTVKPSNIFKMRSANLRVLAIDVFKMMLWTRKNQIKTVIDLELFSRFTAILCALSGARSLIGFASVHDEGLYRGSIINFPVRYNPHVHIAINFMSLINTALGRHDTPYATTPISPAEIQLAKAEISEEEKDSVRKKIETLFPKWTDESLIIINSNASEMLPQRRWMPEYFADVAASILKKFPDTLLVATGAPAEHEYVQSVVDRVNDERFINYAGVFLFEELVPLYSLSTVMLTNDSGPAHFASVTNLKVFVLFGPETPHLYLPLGGNAEPIYLGLPCSPCVSAANHRKTSCETRPCITGISPAMVWGKIDTFLTQHYSTSNK